MGAGYKLQGIRAVARLARRVDDADIAFLRYLPARLKKRLVRGFFRKLRKSLPETINVSGLKIRIPGSLDYSFVLRDHEPEVQRLIDTGVYPGMVAVDVGSNIGFHAIRMAQRVGSEGKVFAVEPASDNLELLRENLEVNECTNVEVLPFAAGAVRSRRRLYLSQSPHRGELR